MIWFISDTHFNHANILKYCPNRKFETIEEHNTHLINEWNKRVAPNDTVFHLGDFALGAIADSYGILENLDGNKVLITGNHDNRHLKDETFRSYWKAIKFGYHEVEVSYKGHTSPIVLCHFPIESWNKIRYGSFHFHGHTHTPVGQHRMRHINRRKDVGVDSNENHSPWGKDEILNLICEEEQK